MNLIDKLREAHAIPDYVIDSRQVFDVTNIADYYFHHERELWALKDFPYPMPPFDKVWVEYKMPNTIWSKKRGETKILLRDDEIAYYSTVIMDKTSDASYTGVHMLWYEKRDGTIATSGSLLNFNFPYAPHMECIDMVNILDSVAMTTDQAATAMYAVHPMLMAFSLMNCKNVEIIRVETSDRLNKARARRNKTPLLNYHMVNVLPMSVHEKKIRTVSRGSIHTDVADVKMRRGSFAMYKDEDGHRLFGKYTGRYWRSQIQKAETGIYEVRVQEKKL